MWIRFIGRKKLSYTNAETMRLTLREFHQEYQLYKNDYDLELSLMLSRTTYERAKAKQQRSEEWI